MRRQTNPKVVAKQNENFVVGNMSALLLIIVVEKCVFQGMPGLLSQKQAVKQGSAMVRNLVKEEPRPTSRD
jgi:hypothetical protein